MQVQLSDSEVCMEENIRRECLSLIQRALVELEDSIQDDWEWNHRRLSTWMKAIVATDESHVAPQNGDINEDFLDQLDAHGGACWPACVPGRRQTGRHCAAESHAT